jgi:hypothetical protein
MPVQDCGQCEKLRCGQRLTDKDTARLISILLCEIADNTAGGGGGGGGSSVPFELLYDVVGDVYTPFIRIYSDPIANIGLDGLPYVVTGTVSPSSGASSSGSIQVDTVTLNERPFNNLKYYTGGATGGGSVSQSFLDYTPNGAGGVLYSGVFAGQPRALEFNEDYTSLYAINSTGLGIYTLNLTTGVATLAAITGLTGGVSVYHISMHPQTGVLWAYAEAGGTTQIYTIDPVSGAATLQGACSFNLNANAGFGFLPDGRLVYCDDPTATSFLIEIIQFQSGTAPAITNSFATGKYIINIGNTGSAFRGPMAATYRGTVLSVPVNASGIGEFDFSGNEVRISTSGSITSGGSIAYFHPLGTRKLFLGVNLRRVTVTDSLGAVISTQYFTPDGTDVTAAILPEYVAPIPVEGQETPVEAIHTHGTIVGTSLTTTYANLIIPGANYNGGCRILQVYNTTDRDVYLAWTNQDNSADQLIVPANGGTLTIDYAAADRVAAGNLQAKAIGSTATIGTLYATIIR